MNSLLNDKVWDDYYIDCITKDTLVQHNFKQPSLVQQIFLQQLDSHDNMSGIFDAPPGTGKTIAGFIAILRKINNQLKQTQAVILCQNLDVSVQTQQTIQQLCSIFSITYSFCLGLQSGYKFVANQHIIIGTPSAFHASFGDKVSSRGSRLQAMNSSSEIKVIIIKDFDQQCVYESGKEILLKCVQSLPDTCQKIVFTSFSQQDMYVPLFKQLLNDQSQFFVKVPLITDLNHHFHIQDQQCNSKLTILKQLFELDIDYKLQRIIIICKTNDEMAAIYQKLTQLNLNCSYIDTLMTNEDEQKQFNDYYKNKTQILITTSIKFYHISSLQISMVIIYSQQDNDQYQNYIEIGCRAYKFNKKSIILQFVTNPKEEQKLNQLNNQLQNQQNDFQIQQIDLIQIEQYFSNNQTVQQLKAQQPKPTILRYRSERLFRNTQSFLNQSQSDLVNSQFEHKINKLSSLTTQIRNLEIQSYNYSEDAAYESEKIVKPIKRKLKTDQQINECDMLIQQLHQQIDLLQKENVSLKKERTINLQKFLDQKSYITSLENQIEEMKQNTQQK